MCSKNSFNKKKINLKVIFVRKSYKFNQMIMNTIFSMTRIVSLKKKNMGMEEIFHF